MYAHDNNVDPGGLPTARNASAAVLIHVLKQEPFERTPEEQLALFDFLTSVPFFAKMTRMQLSIISRCLHHRMVSQDEPVIVEGDMSREFFVIVQGGARVYRHKHVHITSL